MHRPPDLAVDRYGDVAVIHTTSAEILSQSLPRIRSEVELLCPTAYAKVHPRTAREYVPSDAPLWGPPCEQVIVTEHEVRYLVRPTSGLNVGLFLDMREVRQWLRAVADRKTVLNLFAYTCSLGVCASLGGATRVVNVDLSKGYLEWGKTNYALNGCAVDEPDFIYGDAFDWLRRFARREQRFDLVIVDPPSFSSTRFSITRDYSRLVEAAAHLTSAGGVLLAATSHAQTTDATFERWIHEGLSRNGRRGTIVDRWHEPADDFPVPRGQRPYLKVRAVRLS